MPAAALGEDVSSSSSGGGGGSHICRPPSSPPRPSSSVGIARGEDVTTLADMDGGAERRYLQTEDKWLLQLQQDPPLCLNEKDLKTVCQQVRELLVDESNVQHVDAPATVCGDIHGQFFDLLELFRVGGELPHENYVFLGDFVDRGFHSVETLQYLLVLKLKYPRHITLVRGNHETRQITQVYGFYDECLRKYGNANVWKMCTDLFDYFTLAALIDGRVFCVHGGLSPHIHYVDQLRDIDRIKEIPHDGAFGDIVWSDPDDVEFWAVNPRGAGWLFGHKAVAQFRHDNHLQLITRAHQLVQEGYKYHFNEKSTLTIWSAPNYCYRCGNIASILRFDEHLNRHFKLFRETPSSAQSTPWKQVVPYFL